MSNQPNSDRDEVLSAVPVPGENQITAKPGAGPRPPSTPSRSGRHGLVPFPQRAPGPVGRGLDRPLAQPALGGGCRCVAAEPGAAVESPAVQGGVQESNARAAADATLAVRR